MMKTLLAYSAAIAILVVALAPYSLAQLNNPGITALVGDCVASGNGSVSITCTKTSGTGFSPSATVDVTNATNISAGTLATSRLAAGAAVSNLGFTPLSPANNLSDVVVPSTARTNLGLGSLATQSASAVNVSGGTITGTSVKMVTSTVAGLSTCNAGLAGTIVLVTDALTPVYLTTLTGGGSSVVLAVCTGAAWIGA